MTLAFTLLAHRPECVPLVAQWLFDEWGHEQPGRSADSLARELRTELDVTTLPVHLLALSAGAPVGIATLRPHEMMDVFPNRTPWLGNVVVARAARGKGIATALTREIEAVAVSRGFATLYLQTEREDGGLYARLGWQTCDRLWYRNHYANVMTKELGTTARNEDGV